MEISLTCAGKKKVLNFVTQSVWEACQHVLALTTSPAGCCMWDKWLVVVEFAAVLSSFDLVCLTFGQALARGHPTRGHLPQQLECPRERWWETCRRTGDRGRQRGNHAALVFYQVLCTTMPARRNQINLCLDYHQNEADLVLFRWGFHAQYGVGNSDNICLKLIKP